MTPATLTGAGVARNFWRRRSIRSLTICMVCPDPSLGGMSLPRAHPCIAHYRPFTGAHNRTPASEMAGSGAVRGSRDAAGIDTDGSRGDALLGLRIGCHRRLLRARPVGSVRPLEVAMGSVALFRRPGIALLTCSLAFTSMVALATGGAASAAGHKAAPADVAPGAPGAESYFDLARKDCVGTATGTASKVWYTVAGGVLSDTYEPTIDNTNVSTLQYVVTDGSSFTDLQTRDMTYTVSADPTGMACTVTATDAAHGYQLTTTYITDPARDTVLMHTRLSAIPGSGTNVAGLHLYARLDAHVNGNGGGGTANAGANSGVVTTAGGSAIPVVSSTNTVTDATNRTYAVPTYMALADSTRAPQASVGYAGTASDGLTQLDTSHTLTPYTSAPDGHIVATQELAPGLGGTLTLALGFGRTQAGAVSTARGSLATPFALKELKYLAGWA